MVVISSVKEVLIPYGVILKLGILRLYHGMQRYPIGW